MTDEPMPKRIRIDSEDLNSLSRDELVEKLQDQECYVRYLEKNRSGDHRVDDDDGHASEDKLKQQNMEAARRENTLVLRLTNKEQELQDCLNQISEMKQSQTQSTAQLRSMLLDPALNLVFQRMSKEVDESKEKLKQTQNELSAWKFTPDSQTGKKLMAKCRMLLQENEELGKMIASGRTAKLEGEIALQKTLVQEMKKNQEELDEFVGELEEDVEGMQSMIYVLQTQLKDTRDQLAKLQTENQELRSGTTIKRDVSPVANGGKHAMNHSPESHHSPPQTTKSPSVIKQEIDFEAKTSPVRNDVNHTCPESSQEEAMETDVPGRLNDSGTAIKEECDSDWTATTETAERTPDKSSNVNARVLSADSTSCPTDAISEQWSPTNSKTDDNGAPEDSSQNVSTDKTTVNSDAPLTTSSSADMKPVRNGVEQVTQAAESEEDVVM